MKALICVPLALLLAAQGAASSRPDRATVERRFDAAIVAKDQQAWLKAMSSAPNHVGSPHDKANAEWQLRQFRSWGWDAWIERYDVLYPTPIETRVEIVRPVRERLGGQEPRVIGDGTSQDLSTALPPYLAYQGDGDVTASVVYVGYGMPDDYEALAQRGIDVKGRIVLARYGNGWRGLKPKLAEAHGAVGALLYSDPADDGYAVGLPYPDGGARPPHGVQRGSVMDWALHPGDPLTPGVAATESAPRRDRAAAENMVRIPALPISYADAAKIIAQLEGPVVTGAERGALGLAYRRGGTDRVQVHLLVRSDWSLKPIYDVIARLRGRSLPDEWVIRGNHHDAWVFGAADPLTGQVAMMAEARALGQLVRTGWRPQRTIIYASWDGEEPGLLGSTEWAESHADELRRHAVAYINTDDNARGFFGAEGSHDLQTLANAAARDVRDPETGVSVIERTRARILAAGFRGTGEYSPGVIALAGAGGDLPIRPAGSGSDFSPFLDHLGVPTLNLGFRGEDAADGSYHSAYDSFDHVTRFDDPGLVYSATLAKVAGRLVMRAAEDPITPARFGPFGSMLGAFADDLRTEAAAQRERDMKQASLERAHVFTMASLAQDPTGAPTSRGITSEFDLAPLLAATARIASAGARLDAIIERADSLPDDRQSALRAALQGVHLELLSPAGLPGRPWFRNLVYAPGTLTGYAAKTFPAVREGIEQRRFDEAKAAIGPTAAALNRYADRLERALAVVRSRP